MLNLFRARETPLMRVPEQGLPANSRVRRAHHDLLMKYPVRMVHPAFIKQPGRVVLPRLEIIKISIG
jgi:hypothetical protein